MKSSQIVLVIDNVRSLHNLGAIFRTADAVGVKEIILSELCATPPRTEIEKTALGATQTVPWRKTEHLVQTLQELKAANYTIWALEQTPTSTDLFTTEASYPLALIVGHEREGVRQEILAVCDQAVELPMHGKSAHSLNVSNAAAIALYELGRRLWYDKSTK